MASRWLAEVMKGDASSTTYQAVGGRPDNTVNVASWLGREQRSRMAICPQIANIRSHPPTHIHGGRIKFGDIIIELLYFVGREGQLLCNYPLA